jgi:hypothetical protein
MKRNAAAGPIGEWARPAFGTEGEAGYFRVGVGESGLPLSEKHPGEQGPLGAEASADGPAPLNLARATIESARVDEATAELIKLQY